MSTRHKFACLDDRGPEVCTCADENVSKDVICCHKGAGWHRSDVISCDRWDIEVEAHATAVRRNGHGHSDDEHPAYIRGFLAPPLEGTISMDGEPIEGTIHYEALFKEEGRLIPHHESPNFAREVSRRYNESLWGKKPAPNITVQADPVIRKVENALEERRILNGLIRKTIWRDLIFNTLVFLAQLVVAIVVTAQGNTTWALWFCWLVVLFWGFFAVNSLRALRAHRARTKNVGA